MGGQLAVTRSIGDIAIKKMGKFLIPTPEIEDRDIGESDEFIIIGCDGLWDVMTNQEAVEYVRPSLLDGTKTAEQAADMLVNRALAKNTQDNVSVMVIVLKDFAK